MLELVVVISTLVKHFLGGGRKTEGMLRYEGKLRYEYPYGLNEKVDICEDDKNV